MKARKIAQDELNKSLAEQAAQLIKDEECLRNLEEAIKSGTTVEIALATEMDGASASAKEHAIATKGVAGSTDIFVEKQEEAQAQLQATTKASKAAKIGMQALATVGNILLGMAISWGISKLIGYIDDLIHAEERAKENLEELTNAYQNAVSELESLKTEIQNNVNAIKELEDKPNLSWVEQEELEKLREVTKELSLQRELKEDERLKAAEDIYKENQNIFKDSFISSYGNTGDTAIPDLINQLSSGEAIFSNLDLENNVIDMVAALQALENAKKGLTDPAELEEYNRKIEEIRNNLSAGLASISSRKQNLLEIAGIRPLTAEEQATYDTLESWQKLIYEFYSPATWNNLELDSIFDTKGIELTKKQLIELSKAGKLDEETLKNYPKLYEAIKNSQIIGQEGVVV